MPMSPVINSPGTNVYAMQGNEGGLQSLFGIHIGKDTSKLFAASLNGLAIKSGERWLIPTPIKDDGGKIIRTDVQDVTGLTLPIDPRVYRLPVTTVSPGQLIITQDSPMPYVSFVESVDGTHVKGFTFGRREEVETVVPVTVFGFPVFVRIISLFDLLSGLPGAGPTGPGGLNLNSILPFLLFCKSDGDGSDSGLFAALLFSQALGTGTPGGLGGGTGGTIDPRLLLLLCGCGSKDASGLDLLLFSNLLTGTTAPPGGHGPSSPPV